MITIMCFTNHAVKKSPSLSDLAEIRKKQAGLRQWMRGDHLGFEPR